jgi:hypothetical protein
MLVKFFRNYNHIDRLQIFFDQLNYLSDVTRKPDNNDMVSLNFLKTSFMADGKLLIIIYMKNALRKTDELTPFTDKLSGRTFLLRMRFSWDTLLYAEN